MPRETDACDRRATGSDISPWTSTTHIYGNQLVHRDIRGDPHPSSFDWRNLHDAGGGGKLTLTVFAQQADDHKLIGGRFECILSAQVGLSYGRCNMPGIKHFAQDESAIRRLASARSACATTLLICAKAWVAQSLSRWVPGGELRVVGSMAVTNVHKICISCPCV